MVEYGFCLTQIFPDSDVVRENTDQRKPVFWDIKRDNSRINKEENANEIISLSNILLTKKF